MMSTSEIRLCLLARRKLFRVLTYEDLEFDRSSLVMKGFLIAISPFLDKLGRKIRPEANGRSSFYDYRIFLSGNPSSLSSTDAKRTPFFLGLALLLSLLSYSD